MTLSIHFRVDFSDACAIGPGKIALLESIDRTGSLSAAARSLATFGPSAVPALEAALRGRDPEIRRQALAVLEELRGAGGG